MPNELWNALGALLIATALLASHPIKPGFVARLRTDLAMNWDTLQQERTACPTNVPCLMPFPVP